MAVVVYLATGALVLALLLLTVYSSIHRIKEGDLEALLVFGRMQRVLQPGLYFAPPFVSETCPIDQQTMTIDKGDERVAVPAEFEEAVRESANSFRGDGPQAGTTERRVSGTTGTPSIQQRLADIAGALMFASGVFGLLASVFLASMQVRQFLLGDILESSFWRSVPYFGYLTLVHALLAAVLGLSVLVLGERVATRFGTWDGESGE